MLIFLKLSEHRRHLQSIVVVAAVVVVALAVNLPVLYGVCHD